MSGLADDIDGLIEQATTERSHFYTATVLKRCKLELERLQAVIDSRPAINAALPESYILWSQAIYTMEILHGRAKPS